MTGNGPGPRWSPDAPTEVLTAVPAADAASSATPASRPSRRSSGSSRTSGAPRNGLGTPALVLGVLAAGTCWTGWAGVVLGVFAVAVGFLGARRGFRGHATDGGPALGGLALGAVALVVGIVVVWPSLFGTGTFGDGLTLDQCMAQVHSTFEMHLCKSQHLTEFNQRFPNAAE